MVDLLRVQKVYENNVLKSRTDFTYDSSGNVTSQRNYKDGFTDFLFD